MSVLARMPSPQRTTSAIDEALTVRALDRPALIRIANAQVSTGNCTGAELVLASAEREHGSYSAEARELLSRCATK